MAGYLESSNLYINEGHENSTVKNENMLQNIFSLEFLNYCYFYLEILDINFKVQSH